MITKSFSHNRVLIYTTSDRIRQIDMDVPGLGKDLVQKDCEFVDITPVIGAAERLYFVEKNFYTKECNIVCFSYVSYSDNAAKRVYTASGSIKAL